MPSASWLASRGATTGHHNSRRKNLACSGTSWCRRSPSKGPGGQAGCHHSGSEPAAYSCEPRGGHRGVWRILPVPVKNNEPRAGRTCVSNAASKRKPTHGRRWQEARSCTCLTSPSDSAVNATIMSDAHTLRSAGVQRGATTGHHNSRRKNLACSGTSSCGRRPSDAPGLMRRRVDGTNSDRPSRVQQTP